MPVFVVIKEEILPFPDAANPIVLLLFDQEYVVPATPKTLAKTTVFVAEPTQYALEDNELTVGVGFTVMLND